MLHEQQFPPCLHNCLVCIYIWKILCVAKNMVTLHQRRDLEVILKWALRSSSCQTNMKGDFYPKKTGNSLPFGSVGEMRKSRIPLSLNLMAHLLSQEDRAERRRILQKESRQRGCLLSARWDQQPTTPCLLIWAIWVRSLQSKVWNKCSA